MATKDTAGAKQRLVSLRVGEVSLVDLPANEREFLIIKSLEGDDMKTADGQTANPEAGAPAGTTAEPAAAAASDAAAQADDGAKTVESLAEAVEKAIKPYQGKGEGGKMKAELPPPIANALTKIMDMIAKLLGVTTKQTEKADAEVEKGKAQFSKDRMTVMKGALAMLLKVMKDASPEVFAELFHGLDPATFDVTTQQAAGGGGGAANGEYPYPPNVKKALDDIEKMPGQIQSAVEAAVKPLAERLDGVEKAQGKSKSLPEGTNDQATAKSKGSLWKGLL